MGNVSRTEQAGKRLAADDWPASPEVGSAFLVEEQKLIDVVAVEISMLIERREADEIHVHSSLLS